MWNEVWRIFLEDGIPLMIEHLELVSFSVSIAILIALPSGILLSRDIMKKYTGKIIAIFNVAQGLPSLAIIALFLPLLGIGFFPALGIAGAAYATVFSRLIGGIFIILVLFSDKNEIKLNLKDFSFDLQIVKEIYQVGLPAMINRLLFSSAMVVINIILGAFNTTAIAVMGVIFRLQSFFLMCVFGLNQGYLPLVGYNYGHNNPERMKKTIILGSLTAFSFGLIGFIIFQLWPEFLLKLFNSDPKLLRIGVIALRRVSISYFFMVLNIIGVATFQAIGKGMPSLVITFLRQVILLVPGMYLLGKFFGLDATWFTFPIAESLTFILLLIWLGLTLKSSIYKMRQQSTS
jgi:Na+-driven multidrug efflux pump